MFTDFIDTSEGEMEYKIPSLQDGPMADNDTAIIFWSSGTTGIPKGIEHTVRYIKKMFFWMKNSKNPFKEAYLTTTCHFHVGGFLSPLDVRNRARTFLFNHGKDIDGAKTSELLYQEISMFKPFILICGSHHLVLLSQNDPKETSLGINMSN